jgi:hypothetical protein
MTGGTISEQTRVIFRAEVLGGEVTAVFPDEVADHRGHVSCYARIGQHGACSRGWYNKTRPATECESAKLKTELERIGYNLKVCQRWTR